MHRIDQAGIAALVETQQFKSWFAELKGLDHRLTLLEGEVERSSERLAEAKFRCEYWREAAEEALLRAADLRNTCQNLNSEVARLENEAFRQLAAFEEARDEVTALWQKITALEHRCDDFPDEASRVRARARHRRELTGLRKQYQSEAEKKETLWRAEESLWIRVAERTLMIPELEVRAKRLESRYAAHMARVEELERVEQRRALDLADEREELGEVQRELARLRAKAKASFSCLCHEDFLYWPSGDDSRMALVVALVNNRSDFNIEVTSGHVYRCDTDRGVRYLEPLALGVADEDDDPRLQTFFGGVE